MAAATGAAMVIATALPSGAAVTRGEGVARKVPYNAAIAPNASITIGFQATHTGNTARPASFALNGAACTIA